MSTKNRTRLYGLLTMAVTAAIIWLSISYLSGMALGIICIGGFFVILFGIYVIVLGNVAKALDYVLNSIIRNY